MRSKVAIAVLGLTSTLIVAPQLADADARVARSYTVKFVEIANSCENVGVSLEKATMSVAPVGKKRKLTVAIDKIPTMNGRASKKGKFSARAKRGKTAKAGIDGKFSIAGSIDANGKVELMFFAEYYRGKTPVCTTSWKGAGSPK